MKDERFTYYDFQKINSVFSGSTELINKYYHNRNQVVIKVKVNSEEGIKYQAFRCVILKDRIVIIGLEKKFRDE